MKVRWPLGPQLGAYAAFLLALGVSAWLAGYDWTFVPVSGVGGVIGMTIFWRVGAVELSTTELRRWGLHGDKTAYWNAVEAVTFQRHRFSGYPVVWLKSGKQIKLKEFRSFPFGPKHAEEAYRQIGRWWLDHRNPTHQGSPVPAWHPALDPDFDPWRPPPV